MTCLFRQWVLPHHIAPLDNLPTCPNPCRTSSADGTSYLATDYSLQCMSAHCDAPTHSDAVYTLEYTSVRSLAWLAILCYGLVTQGAARPAG